MNNRKNQAIFKALDMTFVIGQKSYEGYDYYDFFEQVYNRLKKYPFYSNLSSAKEVRSIPLIANYRFIEIKPNLSK